MRECVRACHFHDFSFIKFLLCFFVKFQAVTFASHIFIFCCKPKFDNSVIKETRTAAYFFDKSDVQFKSVISKLR